MSDAGAIDRVEDAQEGVPLADEGDLQALGESVAQVLNVQCDSQAIHAFIDGKSSLDTALWAQAAELGWLGVGLPEAYGGLGLGPQGLDVLHRELGRRLAPGPFIPTLSAAQWLVDVGSEADKEAWLAAIAGGELTVAVPTAILGSSRLDLRDGKLHGELTVLGSETAGLAVAPVTDGWALVDLTAEGASLSRNEMWDRTRQVCTLSCSGAQPASLIADPDGGVGRRLARHVALAVTGDSVGGAYSIADQTVEYLKVRVQFDKPVGSFQALKHRVVDHLAGITNADYLLAQGVESATAQSPDADMWAALAKAAASETYAFVAGDCIQLHGGVGHTWEFDVHIFVKRARLNETLGGNNRVQRDFAAQALAGATKAGRITTELGF